MKNGLYEFCVSTIVDRHRLEEFALKGNGSITERRVWKTAQRLLYEAGDQGKGMPVILSDAAYNAERLLLWGILKKVDIQGEQTTVQFNDVQRIRGNHGRQELVLKSSGQPIKPHFIRPYAICETPSFLK
jgi:hypothetical protein